MKNRERRLDLTIGVYIYAFQPERVLLIHHRKLNLWLPVGGHIEPNETPDEAALREAREEVGLEIDLFRGQDFLAPSGTISEILALPFHANVHSVGDHDHCCHFYAAIAKEPAKAHGNHEVKNVRWYAMSELDSPEVPLDVRAMARAGLEFFKRNGR